MDATQANLGISREDFLRYLVATRLFSESELQAVSNAHSGSDAIALAHSLVSSGQLTSYQIDEVCQGKTGELVIGNYEILDRLGAGGMGTVFKARHRRMKRIVALKVLSASLCKDESFVHRFQREVETIAKLSHPNIVMAFDADEAEIGHFLVMEFVDGRDLASTVEKYGPLDLVKAVDYTLQAARGLAYAHSLNIIHRDIKPANLMLDCSGIVKVTDLGLARLTAAVGGEPSTTGITQAGGIVGTVDYMAPEQAVDSTAVDHRADIYSLGCTLHYLLTGKPVYAGGTVLGILVKHRESPIPSLRQARADVPAELDSIYQKMIAKSADARHSTMNGVVAALEGLAGRLTNSIAADSIAPPERQSSGSSVAVSRPDQRTIVALPSASTALSVLLVEPSRLQAGIVKKFLEPEGISVANVVANGGAALAAVRENSPSVVVSSLHLDDMTGIELAKQIRTEIKSHPPGFVLISSKSDDESRELSQLERTMLLAKPFTAEQLLQALRFVTATESNTVHSTDFELGGLSGVVERPGVDRSTLRVLIVDDSVVARTHVRGVLRQLGLANFVEAGDGAQAIAAATREKVDLIVTDYNMPLMDGLALVSYLRQTMSTQNVPIVMVTTESDPHVLDPIRRLGVAEILSKEFAIDRVKPLIDRLF